MVGNPFSTLSSATVTGAELVLFYHPAARYQQVDTIQPGLGAWVYSVTGGDINLTAAAR
ncbi:MAG: hypothetical protein ACR2PL_19980 [Dehalococcoidia bacterium]